MNEIYIPALITGLAGVFGVFVNVIVSIILRINDTRTRNRESNLKLLLQSFLPLCNHVAQLDMLFKRYKSIEPTTDITQYLSDSREPSGNLVKIISDFKNAVDDTWNFIKNKDLYYFGDYKMQYYSKNIIKSVQNWKAALDSNVFVDCVYSSTYYNGLCKRIRIQELKVNSDFVIHRLYLRLWEYVQHNK